MLGQWPHHDANFGIVASLAVLIWWACWVEQISAHTLWAVLVCPVGARQFGASFAMFWGYGSHCSVFGAGVTV